eukprot:TRINITY_DN61722_c0_g1_i1.p1 TRINITY_DN61722_c0_g1~~TRINITY_DN61722_c0_g1_i1.p1  ORF type:complete len:707 (+),score=219.23 TRINITY_DN61722_c0_g1_i1:87-2207(+)
MKSSSLQLLLAALSVASISGIKTILSAKSDDPSADQGHPVKNVIVLLRDQGVKIDEAGRAELKTYNKFKAWCDRSSKRLSTEIEEERATISKTSNLAFAKEKEMEELQKKIDALQKEIQRLSDSIQSADDSRAEQANAFEKADSDFRATVNALSDALKGLKDSSDDAASTSDIEVAGLLQMPLLLGRLSDQEVSMLQAGKPPREMMETRDYEFKSGDIVNLLMDLKQEFSKKMKLAQQAEDKAIREHGNIVSDLEAAKFAAETSKSEKDLIHQETEAKHAELATKLQETTANRAANTKLLEDTTTSCNQKAAEWKERKDIRYDEAMAIKAAIETLAKAAGVRTEVPEMQSASASAALLDTSSKAKYRARDDPPSRAAALLRERGRKGDAASAALEVLASKVQAEGPYLKTDELPKLGEKLNGAIKKQIWALKAEQKAETKTHLWCAEETEKTNRSFIENTQAFDEASAELLEKEARIEELTTDVQAAEKKVSELEASIEEATEIREENKVENKATISDAKLGQQAIDEAIRVLSAFYDGVGQTSLIQKATSKADGEPGLTLTATPETWDSSYTGVADPKADGGVVSILTRLADEMAKMETDTENQEAQDQAAYDEEMKDSKKEKSAATVEIEIKTEEIRRHEKDVKELIKTKASHDRQLASLKSYLNDLAYRCDESVFNQRKEARAQKLEGMEEAQKIIDEAFAKN